LKEIDNEIDRKVKIYMDLKKFENAVGVLALVYIYLGKPN